MRRNRWLIAAVFLVSVACSSDSNGGNGTVTGTVTGTGTGATGSGEGETITLLYANALTGLGSDLGIAGCDRAKLAAKNINDAGGIADGPMAGALLAIECMDNEVSPEVTATIASRYVSDEKYWTMFGFSQSGEAQAAGIVADRAGLSIIASHVAAAFLTDEADNILIVQPKTDSFGYAWVSFCRDYYGGSSIADLSPDFGFIETFRVGEHAAAEDPAIGVELVSEQTFPFDSTQDFTPFLPYIQQADPDCINIGTFSPQLCQVAAAARDLGLTQPIFDFSISSTGPTCVEAGGDAYVGLVFGEAMPFIPEPGSLQEQIGAQYAEEYGIRMSSYGAYAYDSVLLVQAALEAGASTREELLEFMAAAEIQGTTGPLSFNEELRSEERVVSLNEATGNSADALEVVAQYTLHPDGTATLDFVEDCESRPTCQLNLEG